jgi:hypothetical protein
MVSFTSLPLYPLDRRVGGRYGEEKNLALPGIEPGRPAHTRRYND